MIYAHALFADLHSMDKIGYMIYSLFSKSLITNILNPLSSKYKLVIFLGSECFIIIIYSFVKYIQ